MLPLFDCLAHPTLSGDWTGNGRSATFESLLADLKSAGFVGACAVGLAGLGNYAHQPFIERCRQFKELVPVAGLDPHSSAGLKAELDMIKKLGFAGVKVHPRFSSIDLSAEIIGNIFQEIASRDLVIFYCTYFHSHISSYPDVDPFWTLVQALKMAPSARVILVHGGAVEVMRYAELVRFNENLLLDLSLTMLKYRFSSIDQDLRFLFKSFDRRICVGSDHPESSHRELRERFEELAFEISLEKKENIGFRNLKSFLGIQGRP